MEDKKLREILAIDPLDIKEEWLSQPSLYMRASKKAIECRMDFQMAKLDAEGEESKMSLLIRENPVNYGVGGRVTDSVVSATIDRREEVIAKRREVFRKEYSMREAEALVRAVEHRKTALEQLVHLMFMEYNAEPKSGEAGAYAGFTNRLESKKLNNAIRQAINPSGDKE